jgi:hypothetical protein
MESLTNVAKSSERRRIVNIYVPAYRAFDVSAKAPSSSRLDHPQKLLHELLVDARDDNDFITTVQGLLLPLSRSFFGRFYTIENGRISAKSHWDEIGQVIRGNNRLIQVLYKLRKNGSSSELSLKKMTNELNDRRVRDICEDLEKIGLLQRVFEFENYRKWEIKEETLPLVDSIISRKETPGFPQTIAVKTQRSEIKKSQSEDVLAQELKLISTLDSEFDKYLNDLVKNRLEKTLRFGKTFSAFALGDYLRSVFGPNLFFDSLLTISQQYSLCDVPIHSSKGYSGIRTGFNLALFGEPGTGKSYSTRDMILGRDGAVEAHGLPGRNRYAGGITPARFIRLGQAYENRKFNFIVPEFNDWFRYEGMVEPLKIAMERGEIKYETQRETIGPYRFSSFFSVNYNTSVFGKGYDVTIRDPNFSAIEDRMVCRLHRLTKERFSEIAESQRRIAMGESEFGGTPKLIRDHLTLVYALQTGHPLVRNLASEKSVVLTSDTYDTIAKARNLMLSHLPGSSVPFSVRLEERAIRLAASLSLLSFFRDEEGRKTQMTISSDALKFAIQFYIEEGSVRSAERFNSTDVISEMETFEKRAVI